jgi:hypothetical protein
MNFRTDTRKKDHEPNCNPYLSAAVPPFADLIKIQIDSFPSLG